MVNDYTLIIANRFVDQILKLTWAYLRGRAFFHQVQRQFFVLCYRLALSFQSVRPKNISLVCGLVDLLDLQAPKTVYLHSLLTYLFIQKHSLSMSSKFPMLVICSDIYR